MKKIGTLKTYSSDKIEKSYVSIGFECLDRDLFNPDKCYDLLQASGVKYARCQTGWAKCEKEKGIYDFKWLDSIVDNLLQRGIIPWFNVGFGNPLYMPDVPNETAVGCVPLFYGEEALTAWKNFISAMAEHYKTRISHYEIWNEPNIDHFWHPETAASSRSTPTSGPQPLPSSPLPTRVICGSASRKNPTPSICWSLTRQNMKQTARSHIWAWLTTTVW